jgi:hypothetical protein
MSDTAQLDALVQRWRDLQRQGRPTPPEQLCADCPELLPQLKELLAATRATPTGGSDSSQPDTQSDTTRDLPGTSVAEAGPRPTVFAGYQILGVLGEGGMGIVYKARHPTLGTEVALKTLRFGTGSPDLVERFLREARAMADLHHPHIVHLYEVAAVEGVPYFTTAYAAGGSLQRRRPEFQGDARRVAALLEKVARGVGHAHEKGIVHRDLKPGNILLDERGEPLVADFGLAKFIEAVDEHTASGVVLGTAPYMSPEQAAGQNTRISTASDVWALGVILYEMLTGRKPFDASEPLRLVCQIQEADPPRPSAINHKLDKALETVVLKCLERDPGRRYRTAAELADDLGRWLSGEPVLARPRPWPARAWQWLRRRPAVLALALVGAAALAVALGLAFNGPPPESRPEATARGPAEPDQEMVLRHLQADLGRGQAVSFLDKTGKPRCGRWVLGDKAVKESQRADGALVVDTLGVAVFELIRDPVCQRFTLEAKVRQLDGVEEGIVGLVCGYHARGAGPKHHFVLAWEFAEAGIDAGWVKLNLHDLVEAADGAVSDARFPVRLKKQFPPAAAFPPGPGHSMALVVHPHKLQCRWDGKDVGEVSREALDAATQLWLKRLPLPPGLVPPTFEPRQSVGLLVWRGSAAFTEVTLTPVPD